MTSEALVDVISIFRALVMIKDVSMNDACDEESILAHSDLSRFLRRSRKVERRGTIAVEEQDSRLDMPHSSNKGPRSVGFAA